MNLAHHPSGDPVGRGGEEPPQLSARLVKMTGRRPPLRTAHDCRRSIFAPHPCKLAGDQVKRMGNGASAVGSYYPLYGAIAVLALLSLVGLPCLHAIRKREHLNLAPGSAELTMVQHTSESVPLDNAANRKS